MIKSSAVEKFSVLQAQGTSHVHGMTGIITYLAFTLPCLAWSASPASPAWPALQTLKPHAVGLLDCSLCFPDSNMQLRGMCRHHCRALSYPSSDVLP